MSKKITVLYAEDNEHDVLATERAWHKNKIENDLIIVRDGEECIDYLYHRGKYSDADLHPWPALLLLDLNMPKLDGLGVLKILFEDKVRDPLSIVVLTTSDLDEDKIASYNYGVKNYIRKPVGFGNFSEAIKTINLYWALVEAE
ncbi:MAG: response regulator [Pseudohongiella sp.]|nr:response regulator [Pseudohongiella sp.]